MLILYLWICHEKNMNLLFQVQYSTSREPVYTVYSCLWYSSVNICVCKSNFKRVTAPSCLGRILVHKEKCASLAVFASDRLLFSFHPPPFLCDRVLLLVASRSWLYILPCRFIAHSRPFVSACRCPVISSDGDLITDFVDNTCHFWYIGIYSPMGCSWCCIAINISP